MLCPFFREDSTISEFKKGLSIIGIMTPNEPQTQSQQVKPPQSRIGKTFAALQAWFGQNKWAGSILTILLIIIPVYFLGRSLWANWQTLTSAEIEIDWGRMVLSLVILMAAFALFPSGTLIGLRGLGARVTYGQAYYGYHASQLGKYIPGRIWIIPGRAVTMRRFGVDGVTAAASTLIDMYVLLVAGIVVLFPRFLPRHRRPCVSWGGWGWLGCIPLLISIFFPEYLE